MGWSTEKRDQLLDAVDRAEHVVTVFYRALLWLIIVAVVAVAVFGAVHRPWGEGHQGEGFYFSVAVVLVLGWAIGQFAWLSRRRRGRRGQGVPWTARSTRDRGAFTWEFRIGSNADDPRGGPSEVAGRFESSPPGELPPKE